LAHLEELFKRFHEVNMKIHPKECEFVVISIAYFEHIILPNDIIDALSTPFIDSNVSLKWKQQKSKELGHAP
jgi:hypothetical protein